MIFGYVLAFAARYSEGGEGGGGLLSVNPGLAFWTVLIFVLLLIILKKVAWKPILEALDEREAKIKESLELADKAKKEAAELIAENKQTLQKAEEEAKKILVEAQKIAQDNITKSHDEAKLQAQRIVKEAQAEIDSKKHEALSEIKNQIAELSVAVAEKVLRKSLSGQVQKEVIDEYINDIQKN
ncbi:MAG: F0F1 ATP synthase subunit B [Ignavibacteriales bacterium]|nr:F0F1 ATP synthase subunit B [Ignavibacteriales bacterium]